MAKRFAVILAAGQGTRMNSSLYKVLHPVVGRSMIKHVIGQLQTIQLNELVTVVGHGAESVIKAVDNESKFVIQEEQLGTGHAVQQAESLLQNKVGTTIIVCGDTPLITSETYKALFNYHEQTNSQATILTAKAPNPTGYGRVIRNEKNEVERIVEHKDANEQELQIDEINTGTYCVDNELLFEALKEVSNDNAQGEYYLPDIIEILQKRSKKVSAYLTPDFDETLGINDRVALAQAEKIMRTRINEHHMRAGVTIIDPDQTYIGPDVKIMQDVLIHPGSMLSGQTTIGAKAVIGPNTEIDNCVIGQESTISHSVIKDSQVGNFAEIGPYAYIRPESHVGTSAKVGHFVEIKKSTIGTNSKVPHLSYVGDATIGENVNVGCGTITVNYDGKDKYETNIGDDAFIGCNTNLIAPVTVGKNSLIAAGSTITNDVPEDALSIARARQVNKEGYASKIMKKDKK